MAQERLIAVVGAEALRRDCIGRAFAASGFSVSKGDSVGTFPPGLEPFAVVLDGFDSARLRQELDAARGRWPACPAWAVSETARLLTAWESGKGARAAAQYVTCEGVLHRALDELVPLEESASAVKEKIARAKEEYERIFDATPDPIFVVSPALTVERANRAFFEKVGRPMAEVLGRHCVELLHGILEPWGEYLLSKVAEKPGPVRWVLPQGALGETYECTTFPVLLANGTRGAAHHLRSARGAGASDIRVEDVAASLIHELNNPLAAVLGFTEILEDSGACPPELRADLRQIQGEARRCRAIVQNLLTLTRRPGSHLRPTDVHEVIERAISLRSYHRGFEAIVIERGFGTGVPAALVDSDQVEQIVLNLLSNAQDAIAGARRTGRIQIRTGLAGGELLIEVADDGPGIEPEHMPRLFEPLFTTKGAGKGSGLGLAISRVLARQHGGDIAARNAEGGGAVFTVRLPFIAAPEPPKHAATDETKVARIGRILVLDDEPVVSRLLAKVLRRAGHTVVACRTAGEAAETLAAADFDMVMADAGLLEQGGAGLRAAMQARRPQLAERVVVMTGGAGRPAGVAAEYGDAPLLRKPFTPGEVRRAVSDALGLSRKRRNGPNGRNGRNGNGRNGGNAGRSGKKKQ